MALGFRGRRWWLTRGNVTQDGFDLNYATRLSSTLLEIQPHPGCLDKQGHVRHTAGFLSTRFKTALDWEQTGWMCCRPSRSVGEWNVSYEKFILCSNFRQFRSWESSCFPSKSLVTLMTTFLLLLSSTPSKISFCPDVVVRACIKNLSPLVCGWLSARVIPCGTRRAEIFGISLLRYSFQLVWEWFIS